MGSLRQMKRKKWRLQNIKREGELQVEALTESSLDRSRICWLGLKRRMEGSSGHVITRVYNVFRRVIRDSFRILSY
jgi:hypothetical protein